MHLVLRKVFKVLKMSNSENPNVLNIQELDDLIVVGGNQQNEEVDLCILELLIKWKLQHYSKFRDTWKCKVQQRRSLETSASRRSPLFCVNSVPKVEILALGNRTIFQSEERRELAEHPTVQQIQDRPTSAYE